MNVFRKFTRFDLEPGLHTFPKDQSPVEMALVRRALLGPGETQAQPESDGEITEDNPGLPERTLRRRFSAGRKSYRLEVTFDFTEPLLVLDRGGVELIFIGSERKWAETVFGGTIMGDMRRTKRLVKLATAMARRQQDEANLEKVVVLTAFVAAGFELALALQARRDVIK